MYSNLWIACDNDRSSFPVISDHMPIKYKSGICRSSEGNKIMIPFHSRPKIPITFNESPKKINVKLDPNGEFWVARDTLPGFSFSLQLFEHEPKYDICWSNRYDGIASPFWDYKVVFGKIPLDDRDFPEVTFENSPQRVSIEII